ncbi:hypothetical protein CXG81DRAFT_14631, partial [Caulochytrium protostelioides]
MEAPASSSSPSDPPRPRHVRLEGGQIVPVDYVFNGAAASQADVYEAADPIVQRFCDGHNATLLAYGQTGSGKTYTMGTHLETYRMAQLVRDEAADAYGLIPRAVQAILARMDGAMRDRPGYRFRMTARFLELYNEDLVDLLALRPDAHTCTASGAAALSPSSRPRLSVREDAAKNILVQGCRTVTIAALEDIIEVLVTGLTDRQTSRTDMNESSSRSHAILTLELTQWTPLQGQASRAAPGGGAEAVVTSKLHFVDLAGSERLKRTGATGDRQREGIAINGGLLALSNVISALAQASAAAAAASGTDRSGVPSATHIPYRRSKLTRVLQDSLGGDSHALLLACVSPAAADLPETRNTLAFACRGRRI